MKLLAYAINHHQKYFGISLFVLPVHFPGLSLCYYCWCLTVHEPIQSG